ncbi:hypothetical protein SUGI_0611570 [Cryptomeria japonica]|nr:hypothetical protein SUGI_0611570 [Cryptomeria japonica]
MVGEKGEKGLIENGRGSSLESVNNGVESKVGFQSAEALVEDGINHACQQLTMKLSDIHMASRKDAEAGARRADVAVWLKCMFESEPLHLADEPSEEDLRACLSNGTLLCNLINKLNPGSIPKIISNPSLAGTEGAAHSAYQRFENLRNFLVAIDELRLPTFEASDLEQGSMVNVIDCLLSLKEYFDWKHGTEVQSLLKQATDIGILNEIKSTGKSPSPGKFLSSTLKNGSQPRKRWILPDLDNCLASDTQPADESPGSNGQKSGRWPLKPGDFRGNVGLEQRYDFESLLTSSIMSDSTTAWIQHIGQKFRELLQVKAMRYPDIQAVECSGMLKCLDNAPSQSFLSLVSAILGDKHNEEVPSLVEFMLRKVMEEFERRLLAQGEHTKKLKLALREVIAREDKIMSRANGLEALAAGTAEEIKLLTDQLHKIKMENTQVEDERKAKEQDIIRLIKEREESNAAIQALKEELEMMKKTYQEYMQQLESQKCDVELDLQKKLKETEDLLVLSKRKTEELEETTAMELQSVRLRDAFYQKFSSSHFQALQETRMVFQQTKEEVIKVQESWKTEIAMLEEQLKGIANVATKYHKVLAENRQLYNEVQDLKGNIRVYCRVRPFISGESGRHTTIEYIGENGELIIANPNKQGKDSPRMFNFNKVFGSSASQEEVFLDTRPLIRSVLDGYNVCIFAYGQTGSGKTFTMTGPNSSSEEDWGVNYRAINDLFQISQKRRELFRYEVGVQMIEIYNEQVRDLLINDGSQKRYPLNISQQSGLSVPDASMFQVESTADVVDLMKIGQRNRAVGATALNERSSRSHSVLTVHVQGTDLSSGAALRGCLHLVDLAGSERVDKSEVTGDRLKEAQHINKSLSALGDVIYALANKSVHVPYRNSKLTQILQDSLGGQAKTLMFVQLNPDIESYSETISTLKFAERVSGVELGAARSNRESKDVRDLKEQVAMLKDVITKKDAEIVRLQINFQDVYVPKEKLRVKVTNFTAQSNKVATGRQGHKNQSLTIGRRRSSEDHQTLSGQASKYSLRQSTQSSQDCESTSTGDSDDICGKYGTPVATQHAMASKRSVDSKMELTSSQVTCLETKLQKDSFMEDDVSKECQDGVRSSSNSSLLGTLSLDETTSQCSAKMGKMNEEGISLVDKHSDVGSHGKSMMKRVSDDENVSEYSDKHSDVGSHETSMNMSKLLQYKDHRMPFKQDAGNVRSFYSSLESTENSAPDVELFDLKDGDLDERLSEISDGNLSMGTETDGSISSIVELTLFPEKKESGKLIPENDKRLMTPSHIPRPPGKSQRKTLLQPHTSAGKSSTVARGTDRSSARRPNGQSTIDTSWRKGSQRPVSIDSPQASICRPSISHRQAVSSQLSGCSSSSKRWQ